MAVLHIVNKSPFERNSLESALAYAKKWIWHIAN